jgi:hypothetical protein
MGQDGMASDVNVSASQGVQVGAGGTLINNWALRPPLTPDTLAALNPKAGAARIRQLSHDEGVNLFAEASLQVLTPKLRALLSVDPNRAVAILADLDASKAAELISPLAADFPWLPALPEADEAIFRHATDLKWEHESGGGRLQLAPRSPYEANGYLRRYPQGCIYWSDGSGVAYAVSGPVADFHMADGGTGGSLGFPVTSQGEGFGSIQSFEGGHVYSSFFGTYCVPRRLEIARSGVGFPIGPVKTQGDVESQHFESGIIYSSKAGTFAVRSQVAKCIGRGWVPTSAEGANPRVITVLEQRFRDAMSVEMVVYSSAAIGVQAVIGRTLAFYESLGGICSKLGFPIEAAWTSAHGSIQEFGRGVIYEWPGFDPVVVPHETDKLIGDRLGWPVSQEQPIGTGADSIQFFENGAVILQDGKRQVWVCGQSPESQHDPGDWPEALPEAPDDPWGDLPETVPPDDPWGDLPETAPEAPDDPWGDLPETAWDTRASK